MCEGEGPISSSLRRACNRERPEAVPVSTPMADVDRTYTITSTKNVCFLYVGGNDYPMFMFFRKSRTLIATPIFSPSIKNWFLGFMEAGNSEFHVVPKDTIWWRNYVKRLYD